MLGLKLIYFSERGPRCPRNNPGSMGDIGRDLTKTNQNNETKQKNK